MLYAVIKGVGSAIQTEPGIAVAFLAVVFPMQWLQVRYIICTAFGDGSDMINLPTKRRRIVTVFIPHHQGTADIDLAFRGTVSRKANGFSPNLFDFFRRKALAVSILV